MKKERKRERETERKKIKKAKRFKFLQFKGIKTLLLTSS